MKTLKFNILVIIALLISLNVNGERISKRVYKNYPISAVKMLDVSNKFGNIYIENGRTDSVVISANIWVEGTSDRARELLNSIDVSVNLSGNKVIAVTHFQNMNNSNNEFSIDYYISIPVDRDLAISQMYGIVNMKNLIGNGTFDIKYGALDAQKLASPNLKIDLSYSKARIEEVLDLLLTLRYSKLQLEKGNNLKVEDGYSELKVASCKQIDAEVRYGNFSLGNINILILNSMYTGVTVDKLTSKFNLINGYGGITIKEIPAGFESITIESKYAGIKLGIASDATYKLNGMVRYSDIKHPNGKLNRMRENNNYEVNGIIGNSENPRSTVHIESSYGSVNLIP
jgi:hypothetical protein